MARAYDYGRGVAQDWKEAVYWYQKAVDAGSAYAMCDLGVCYERGEGVQQDYAKAAELYRQAAEAGNPPGQCNLGYLYEIGQGVEQNWEEAVLLVWGRPHGRAWPGPNATWPGAMNMARA